MKFLVYDTTKREIVRAIEVASFADLPAPTATEITVSDLPHAEDPALLAEADAAWAAAWAGNRVAAYPTIGDQLDLIIKTLRHLSKTADLGPDGRQLLKLIDDAKTKVVKLPAKPSEFAAAVNRWRARQG